MFALRGWKIRLLTGGFAGIVLAAFLVSQGTQSPASETIDQIITAAVPAAPLPAAAPQAMPAALQPTDAFGAALKLIDSHDSKAAWAAAATLSDPLEQTIIRWAAIYQDNGEIAPADIRAFTAASPDFAAPGIFRTRLEQALVKADPPAAEIIADLGGETPNTLDAKLLLARSYLAAGKKDRATAIARDIWLTSNLSAADEARVREALGSLLTARDHWARAQHMMMNDRTSAVERLLPLLTPAQRTLAVARNAVSRNAADAKSLLDKVDPALKTNPIYYFSRAQRARQFQLWDDAIAFLDKGKPTDPDAEEWWYERRALVRALLSAGDPQRAYRAAAGYTKGPEGRLVEARFHAGWIALSFLNDSASAAKQFAAMAKLATLADSVTQANYWLGRARTALGDSKGAAAAYEAAARYGTVYYGLLARDALGHDPVELRPMPRWQDDETTFEARPVVRAIHLLMAQNEPDLAAALLRHLTQSTLKSGGEFVLAARLAQKIDAHHLAIAIADIADKRGVPLDLFSFPKDGLPTEKLADVDMAAIYAITRTESRFQVDAVSSSGAKGLMQLMPATAKETAEKLGVAWSPAKLTSDPSYNALLGSSYLARQLASYDGSLLLAAAAYNAGAGNANKWITAFGDPRAPNVDPVVWVELIPFQETRKYVQRVLGNYLVYRARLGGPSISPVKALHSIAG